MSALATPDQVREILGRARGLPMREWLDDTGAVVGRPHATMLRLTCRLDRGFRTLRVDISDLHELQDVLPGVTH